MSKVYFFVEDLDFDFQQLVPLKKWVKDTAKQEGHTIEELNYIFCSDDYLLEINIKYLEHDFLTDIITFDNSLDSEALASDMFISIDRVTENALINHTLFYDEISRVMIHGLLHLCGYNDKTRSDELLIREKEDHYLSLRKN